MLQPRRVTPATWRALRMRIHALVTTAQEGRDHRNRPGGPRPGSCRRRRQWLDEVTPAGRPAQCCCHAERFTEREVDVLCQVAAGASNEEVASTLGISGHTVAGHLPVILRPTQPRNPPEFMPPAHAS